MMKKNCAICNTEFVARNSRAKYCNKNNDKECYKKGKSITSRAWNKNNWEVYRKATDDWRKRNPDKVKAHMKKADAKRSQKKSVYMKKRARQKKESQADLRDYVRKCQHPNCCNYYQRKLGGGKYCTKWCFKDSKNIRQREKYYSDIKFRINNSIRSKICKFKSFKGQKTFKALGFTVNDLIYHLKSQFTTGMTIDNYGEWHIDHIIPITAFDFDSIDHPQFKTCWALGNLRPMWAEDNIRKGDKIPGVDYI